MDISPSISHKMNIDIHIWTNDYSLRVYSGPFDHAYICQEQVSDHNEVERILEACAKQMTEVCRTIYDLDDSLQTLETTTGFALDTVRSDLLAFIVGVYGMNILNGLESEPAAFYRVLGGSACLIVGLIVVGMTRLLVYRRIRLSRKRKRT
ncbi:unnamed protein product [Rotaria socialis]|uniref:Uncharacterized protein n=2 Tax=Rotaria socialis TaxID=392032 RepID=A0A817V3X5_9BILA|nr:unnamed protein product [Rotaria socialis]